MATEMRDRWTDDRLDDFRREVKRRFDKVEGEMQGMLSEVNARFDGLQRTMMLTGSGIIVALLGVVGTQI